MLDLSLVFNYDGLVRQLKRDRLTMAQEQEKSELLKIYGLQGKKRKERLTEYMTGQLPSKDTYPQIAIQTRIEKGFFFILDFLKESGIGDDEKIEELTGICIDVAEAHGVSAREMSQQLVRRLLAGVEDEKRFYSDQRKKKERTRELILSVALKMFAERGYHATTMDAIAKKARLGKGTVYRYFKNKETVLAELVESHFQRLEARINAVFDERDDVLTIIAKYLRVYFQFFDSNKEFYKILVQEQREFGSKVKNLYFSQILRRVPGLKRKIYEAAREGLLKDVDFLTVFYGVMGFVDGVMKKWIARNCSYSLLDDLPTVLETIFYGFVEDRYAVGPVFDSGKIGEMNLPLNEC